METKFKVGDKVRYIGDVQTRLFKPDKLLEFKDELVVDHIASQGSIAVMHREGMSAWYRWFVKENEIELLEFSKRALRPGDVVTLRNGDKLVLTNIGTMFSDIDGEEDNHLCSLSDLTDDLMYTSIMKHRMNGSSDIMKVERPTYRTVYEREEETRPRKMTVEEISKELGYDVEIVKG